MKNTAANDGFEKEGYVRLEDRGPLPAEYTLGTYLYRDYQG